MCSTTCLNGGTCSAPDKCSCRSVFTGDHCEEEPMLGDQPYQGYHPSGPLVSRTCLKQSLLFLYIFWWSFNIYNILLARDAVHHVQCSVTNVFAVHYNAHRSQTNVAWSASTALECQTAPPLSRSPIGTTAGSIRTAGCFWESTRSRVKKVGWVILIKLNLYRLLLFR